MPGLHNETAAHTEHDVFTHSEPKAAIHIKQHQVHGCCGE